MKRRIFLFHTLALLTAMLALLAIIGGVVHGVSVFYRKQAVPMAQDGLFLHG